MCGIIGYVGSRPSAEVLIQGLRRLEYRGYDSAGVALLKGDSIEVRKSEGRLENVELILKKESSSFMTAKCGMGHTRWATHGLPNTQNAHPHKTGHVVIIHNGIIENYLEIKKEILSRGYRPKSETDSELFGFLVLDEMNRGQPLPEAVRRSFNRLHGQSSVLAMSETSPGTIVGVRNGSPLVAALDPEGGSFLASDAQAIIQYSTDIFFLENGDYVVATAGGLEVFDLRTGHQVQRESSRVDWSPEKLDKGGFPHYMLKEIHEMPNTIVETLNAVLDRSVLTPFQLASQPGVKILEHAKDFIIVACGTSWHAALLGKYWIESIARIPVSVELASEFRYRNPAVRPGTVVIGISQSGETADTLAALREMKKNGATTIGITNTRGSTLAREASAVFFTSAGPEIGVAATKTYLAQMLILYLIAAHLGSVHKHGNPETFLKKFEDILKLPHLLALGLVEDSATIQQLQKTIKALNQPNGFFFLGRGYSFPVALEGALKLKEITYEHAEGYAAGELKHGPIAMIDKDMVVVVLAPRDQWRDKTVSNLEEVKARGGTIVGIGDSDDPDLPSLCKYWIPLPAEARQLNSDFIPFVLTPVIQLLSYYRGVLKGTDVDKPRNLAKSVTVE